MVDLHHRVAALEHAVVSLAALELGDVSGHDFHGNQWTQTDTGEQIHKSDAAAIMYGRGSKEHQAAVRRFGVPVGQWTEGGKKASAALGNKILEKAGIKTASWGRAQYTHRGQMAGGGAKVSRGILLENASADTRLSYSHGSSAYAPTDTSREKAVNEIAAAREALALAGYETRELSFLKGVYEVQKPPKNG